MGYSLQKVISASVVLLLAACSNDQSYKHQINNGEDYLKSAELVALRAPAGLILPVQNGQYLVNQRTVAPGNVGLELDIRPPSQPIALITGSRVQYSGNTATLVLENSARTQGLWPQVTQVLEQNGYAIAERADSSQTLTTEWITWSRSDENAPYSARYLISVETQGYQSRLSVRALEIKSGDSGVNDAANMQRYSIAMLNRITESLERHQQSLTAQQSSGAAQAIVVQATRDESGLPLAIVRAPYNTVWDRLPAVLRSMGMDITERNRAQGAIDVKYKPTKSNWDTLNVTDPDLKSGDYKLQVGDLDNRSTLQFSTDKGQVLREDVHNALVEIVQSAFNRNVAENN